MRKSIKIIAVLALILSANSVLLNSVTTVQGTTVANMYGSVAGSTYLYFQGSGFGTDPSMVSIQLVGGTTMINCDIPADGLTDSNIACLT